MRNPDYLGDGVYAEHDNYGIWLRTGDHRERFCENKIYLEPDVYKNLVRFHDGYLREVEELKNG